MSSQLPPPLLLKFREKFWDAFHRPALKTNKYLELWESLEEMNSWLAGPLFAVYENGNCDFIFENKDRFGGISTLQDFIDWTNNIIVHYSDSINNSIPAKDLEISDKNLLLYQIEIKRELIDLFQKTSNK